MFLNRKRNTNLILLILTTVIVAGFLASPVKSQDLRVDPILQTKLENRIQGFGGDVGIYVEHLQTGATASINADVIYPTASMIKVPIMLTLFNRMEQDTLSLGTTLIYRDSLHYSGSDILGSFSDGDEIQLDKVLMLMATVSDNTGSLWLQELAGTGTAINDWLQTNGYTSTRMNSRTPGRGSDWETYGWGQTTPREMASFLTLIRNGEAVSPEASEEMYRTLTRSYLNDESLSQIPPFVQAASKQGAVSASRSEVVLVNAPSGDYVFCIITNNQEDQSWDEGNEGYRLIRSISETLWQHFEPSSGWRPAVNE